MHYAEFAEDEVRNTDLYCSHGADGLWQSIALREAIREYEANKWKVIGQKVGKPAKVSLLIKRHPLFRVLTQFRLVSSMRRNTSETSSVPLLYLSHWPALHGVLLFPFDFNISPHHGLNMGQHS